MKQVEEGRSEVIIIVPYSLSGLAPYPDFQKLFVGVNKS